MSLTKVATTMLADLASQAEAEAGSDNTKLMTPLRVAQEIAVKAGPMPTTTDNAVGNWKRIYAAKGSALNAPSTSGHWAYLAMSVKDPENTVGDFNMGIVAGGAQILAGSSNYVPSALVWRID